MKLRHIGMIAALFTLIAASFGVFSLTTFGYNARDIVVILVPMAVGVSIFFVGLTYLGTWIARRAGKNSDDGEAS